MYVMSGPLNCTNCLDFVDVQLIKTLLFVLVLDSMIVRVPCRIDVVKVTINFNMDELAKTMNCFGISNAAIMPTCEHSTGPIVQSV